MTIIEALNTRLAKRRNAYSMDEVYFTNRNGNVTNSCTKQIDLNMAVASNNAFHSTYPKIREFLQNAFDYLGLTMHGIRRSDVVLSALVESETVVITFSFEDTHLLKIVLSEHTLTIYQSFTHPLEKMSLQNPVCDASKRSGQTAGGFGVGYKDAVREFLHEQARVKYVMCTELEKIEWTFISKSRSTQYSFYAETPSMTAVVKTRRVLTQRLIHRSNNLEANKWLPPDTLCIFIEKNNIGSAFFLEVLPKITALWNISIDVNSSQLVGVQDGGVGVGGDFFLPREAVNIHSDLINVGVTLPWAKSVSPPAGVFCMGLFVTMNALPDAILLAGSNSVIRVAGRDRSTLAHNTLKVGLKRILISNSENPVLVDVFNRLSLSNESNWIKPTHSDFYLTFLGQHILIQLCGIRSPAIFVDKPKTPLETWLVDESRRVNPLLHVQVLDPNDALGIFTRATTENLTTGVFTNIAHRQCPPHESARPLHKAFRKIVDLSTLDDPPFVLLHSAAAGSKHFVNPYVVPIQVATNCDLLSVSSVHSLYIKIVDSNPFSLDHIAHRMFRSLYSLPQNANEDAILNVLNELDVEESRTGSSRPVTERVEDAFASLKRLMDTNGLELRKRQRAPS